MRLTALAVMVVALAACSEGSPGSNSSVSAARAIPSATVAGVAAKPCQSPSSTYGLLLTEPRAGSSGKLEMVAPTGCVQAKAPMAPASAHACGPGLGVVLAPQVSASNNKVYFLDGDTKIRSLTPSGQIEDVTTVPGSANIVSSFSVSPDDQRIAVVVEDLSALPAISLQLYVEDLNGGGHHSVIYTTTFELGKGGANLWALGWHNASLVLAVVSACSFEPVPWPLAWHIVDSATAIRQFSVGTSTCLPGWWPSPAGFTCFDLTKSKTNLYDWSGNLETSVAVAADRRGTPSLSLGGELFSMADGGGLGNPSPSTTIYISSGGETINPKAQPIRGAMACLWIDNTALLAPGAVIQYPSGVVVPQTPGSRCAGRFPGAL